MLQCWRCSKKNKNKRQNLTWKEEITSSGDTCVSVEVIFE
jgi:hypothetical protein